MIDLYLRVEDEATMIAGAPWLREPTGDGWFRWRTADVRWALDPLGPLELTPATYNEGGEVLVPATLDTNFHANLRCEPEIAARIPTAWLVTPARPARVWA